MSLSHVKITYAAEITKNKKKSNKCQQSSSLIGNRKKMRDMSVL